MPNTWWSRLLLKEWALRVSALIVGIYLYQFVIWIMKEDGLWLPETVSFVTWTLVLSVATFLIPRIRTGWRALIQFVLIIWLHGLGMGYHWVSVEVKVWRDALRWIGLNAGQLEPYIWFSIGAWITFLFAMWSIQERYRIVILIFISILFFAVRDSFSTIFLWPQVAMILLCGFLLLIVRHFTLLKKRAPDIWETISDYPSSFIVPIVILVGVIAVAGVFAPTVNPLLTDPYTAWKVSRGETVPMLGKGVSVVTSTADASSGYSRDDSQLGGGFRFDYTPVMSVESSKRTYFRGETRSLYNGKGWELTPTEKRLPLYRVNLNPLPPDPRFDLSQLKTKEVTQSVVMERDEVFPVLFGGTTIQRIIEVNKGENPLQRIVWAPRQSELRFTGRNNYPKDYKLVTQEPIIEEDLLRAVKADYANKPEWAEYLQVPADLPERVKQLAADITKTATNPYDKAKLIEKYLSEHFPYTNTPDDSKAKSKDFVDRFLFEVKQGYCDYFSTAMAVMTRSLGLPTRWVKGYSSGSSSIANEIREQGILSQLGASVDLDGAATYTIRNSDAHSWVEVYFEGFGWISFEPTSGFKLPNVFPEAAPPPVDELPDSDVSTTPETTSDAPSLTWLWLTLSGVAAAGLAAVGLFFLMRSEAWHNWRERRKQMQVVNWNQKIVVEFERMLRSSRRKGYTRHEHETLREATTRWSTQSKWLKKELDALIELFERAKYSKLAFTEVEYQQVNQLIIRVKEQMK
ncbi:transglutaminase TgpA family protein [Paenibacillus roseipurpureus]|uniref:Transglutaminase domain-containing protein n=1 Tax=Paenibacillus roseopurpureus TaxID=2918901 RepID=A0AA96LXG6_9BACL|nr:transglutaminase domain-containing protein [Paenibacillus sp. MBLB1832]WNR46330.1 transglutaminase domain-containing protein [Paenibacillus sp. MBLB1832]